eukprot:m.99313 g.99313  ORF g.99313 m.99313 type:complete len:104 (+) comp27145_c0_seq1:1174-1485(+)
MHSGEGCSLEGSVGSIAAAAKRLNLLNNTEKPYHVAQRRIAPGFSVPVHSEFSPVNLAPPRLKYFCASVLNSALLDMVTSDIEFEYPKDYVREDLVDLDLTIV